MAKVDIKDWQAKHGTAMAAITAVEAALQDIPSSVMGPRKPDVFAKNQAALHATISGEIEAFRVSLTDDYKRQGEDTVAVGSLLSAASISTSAWWDGSESAT